MDEATREFNPEMMNDPAAMQEMMNRMQSQDIFPEVVSTNVHARQRLETSLSLVEGWVDYVVGSALGSRVPEAAMIGAAWESFRTNGTPAMQNFTKTLGISLSAPKAAEAADLWRRLEEAVGTEKRDAIWDHADFLPVAEDLDNPAAFIGHETFDADDMKDFNPISEIERLERELQQDAEKPEDKNGEDGSSQDDGKGGTGEGENR